MSWKDNETGRSRDMDSVYTVLGRTEVRGDRLLLMLCCITAVISCHIAPHWSRNQ